MEGFTEIQQNVQYIINQNAVSDYLLATGVFLILLIVLPTIHSFFVHKIGKYIRKTKNDIDDVLLAGASTFHQFFFIGIAVYFALLVLNTDDFLTEISNKALLILITIQFLLIANVFIEFFVKHFVRKSAHDEDSFAEQVLIQIGGIIIWSIGVIFILSNLGINVTSLIAGLGIGGIAVALAAQNILGDLFSYFAILFDKPFVVGDFIIVGNTMGTVEHIGIKTTRIRALDGEQIVVSNQELTSARIQNYKRLNERRVVFRFGIEYSTSTTKMKKIPDVIKGIIEKIENARFERAHFFNYGNSSLDYEVVYYVTSSNYNEYMNIHQNILLQLKEAAEGMKVAFAFPTQTVHIEKS